jgi:uncharacterized membrane-anchored protein YitT (DUF2179 family)
MTSDTATRHSSPPHRHALYEDALAITLGTLFLATGVVFYSKAMLVTGGTTGMGLLLQYVTGWGFWVTFVMVNLPFFLLALLRMGWRFTLRSVLAVAMVSFFAATLPGWLRIESVHPLFATLFGGALMGNGLLILFRHRTALGGVNILALFLHERFGWRTGYIQLVLDLMILAVSALVLPVQALALSLIGAVVVNMILAINHRPERYLGQT